MLAGLYSRTPYFGTASMQQQVQQLEKIQATMQERVDLFRFFIRGDWTFENKRIYQVLAMMTPEELEEFDADCRNLEWQPFISDYLMGLSIYALKEDKVEPLHKLQQVIPKNKSYFDFLFDNF